jgi:large subunit ribosomal protein L22
MAEEKKDTEKQQKKPARKPAAKKSSGGSGGTRARKPAAKPKKETKAPARKTAEKKPAAEKPAAKKTPAKAKSPAAKKAPAKPKEAPERPVVNARARFVRVAPRKARLVADLVRGLPLEDALPLLRFSTRSAAQDIRKLVESAAANAEANHDLVADDLLIKDIHVDEGPTLRRYRPRALGRATRINKRTSHIVVALTPEE